MEESNALHYKREAECNTVPLHRSANVNAKARINANANV
jgi:hypothetical protein